MFRNSAMDDASSLDSSVAGSAASRRGRAAADRPVPLPKAFADIFRARYIEFDNKMKKDPSINRLHRTRLFREELAPQIALLYPGRNLDELVKIVQRWFYNDRNRNRELWPSSSDESSTVNTPYRTTAARRSSRGAPVRGQTDSGSDSGSLAGDASVASGSERQEASPDMTSASMLPLLTPQPRINTTSAGSSTPASRGSSDMRSPASRKDYEQQNDDDDYISSSDESDAETSAIQSSGGTRKTQAGAITVNAESAGSDDKASDLTTMDATPSSGPGASSRKQSRGGVSTQYPDLRQSPDAVMMGEDDDTHSTTSTTQTNATCDAKRPRSPTSSCTLSHGSPPPLMERGATRQAGDAPSQVLEGNGQRRTASLNEGLMTGPQAGPPVAAGEINPLHLLSDAVALAFNNMTAAPANVGLRGGVSGAGELVEEGYSERAGGKGAEEEEDGEIDGIGTPYIVSDLHLDMTPLRQHFQALELERTPRSTVLRARPTTQVTEGWGPFSRVQEHPWSIHYRNPRIDDPELYDVARLSSAYGRDTTPHSQSLGWNAYVEESYVSQVRRVVDAKFGVGRKLPFALQALRYKGGIRKSPHFDPAGYTVIAGLNVCGSVDITLTKDNAAPKTIKVNEGQFYVLWEDAVDVCKHQASEPLDSDARIVLILRFIDANDFYTLQHTLREARIHGKVIRPRM